MTTEKHTPLAFGAPLTADELNAPLGELDAAIVTVDAALGGTGLAITTTDASAGAGQKVVPVTATDNFIVGQPFWIGDVGGTFEVAVIASIQAGVSLTTVVNLANTYAAGKIVSASPAELVDARGAYATLPARLLATAGNAGVVFPGGPAAGDLFRRTDRGGALYTWTGAAWTQVSVPTVAAFWGTPSTNDRCYRSDRRLEYFYDGTRWLTTTLFEANFSPPFGNTVTGLRRAQATFEALYDAWLVDWHVAAFVSAPNDGTNFWEARVESWDAGAVTTRGTLNTSAVGSGVFVRLHVVINALLGITVDALSMWVATVGAPGAFSGGGKLTYRLVG